MPSSNSRFLQPSTKGAMTMASRREFLAATAGFVAVAGVDKAMAAPQKSPIGFGNPDDPPQGALNAANPRSITDPGPQNPAVSGQFPSAFSPAPTDVGN